MLNQIPSIYNTFIKTSQTLINNQQPNALITDWPSMYDAKQITHKIYKNGAKYSGFLLNHSSFYHPLRLALFLSRCISRQSYDRWNSRLLIFNWSNRIQLKNPQRYFQIEMNIQTIVKVPAVTTMSLNNSVPWPKLNIRSSRATKLLFPFYQAMEIGKRCYQYRKRVQSPSWRTQEKPTAKENILHVDSLISPGANITSLVINNADTITSSCLAKFSLCWASTTLSTIECHLPR